MTPFKLSESEGFVSQKSYSQNKNNKNKLEFSSNNHSCNYFCSSVSHFDSEIFGLQNCFDKTKSKQRLKSCLIQHRIGAVPLLSCHLSEYLSICTYVLSPDQLYNVVSWLIRAYWNIAFYHSTPDLRLLTYTVR